MLININDYNTLPDFIEDLVDTLKQNGKILVINDKGVIFQAISVKRIEEDLMKRVVKRLLENPDILEDLENSLGEE